MNGGKDSRWQTVAKTDHPSVQKHPLAQIPHKQNNNFKQKLNELI